MNPTEKGFPNNLSPTTCNAESEPLWLRDMQAATVEFDIPVSADIRKVLENICEGEKIFCEYCGAEFVFWPMKDWADHQISEHGANMTIQVRSGNALLCQHEFNEAMQALFSAQFTARVSMRRRAWKLGYAVVRQPEGRVKLSN
jgi:hypothetical protein